MSQTHDPVLDELFKNKPKTEDTPSIPKVQPETPDQIIAIIDRSGSMAAICDDAQGGFNQFVADQKAVDRPARFTLVQFDTEYEMLYDQVDMQLATKYELHPRGGTALLDAIGFTLSKLPTFDSNTKVIVVIVTDGAENSSREYTREQIFNMISERQNGGWEFLFLAANQDAIAAGGSLGIRSAHSVGYTHTARGATYAYDAASTYTGTLRMMDKNAADTALSDFVQQGEQSNQAQDWDLGDLDFNGKKHLNEVERIIKEAEAAGDEGSEG